MRAGLFVWPAASKGSAARQTHPAARAKFRRVLGNDGLFTQFSAPVAKPMLLSPAMIFNVVRQCSQGIFDLAYEIDATGGQAAQAENCFALGPIVSYRQDLSIRSKPVRRALDQVVRCLA